MAATGAAPPSAGGAAEAVLGVDGGGTKTDAALVAWRGGAPELVRRWRLGPANWQAVGCQPAREMFEELLMKAAAAARQAGVRLRGAAYGLAGEDRPRDSLVFEAMLDPAEAAAGLPALAATRVLVNDTFLVVRGGTDDGVGVGVVSGTGSNCCGIDSHGRPARIGGLGFTFGDDGSAAEIGTDGLRAAFRSLDGRGPETRLVDALMTRFGLARLDDLVDRFVADAERPLGADQLAPLVVACAADGDPVCLGVLEHAGHELGHSAVAVARQLFDPQAAFPVVLGGSVFQRTTLPTMRDAVARRVARDFPQATVRTLDYAPVVGAVLLALDRLLGGASAYDAARTRRALGVALTPSAAGPDTDCWRRGARASAGAA